VLFRVVLSGLPPTLHVPCLPGGKFYPQLDISVPSGTGKIMGVLTSEELDPLKNKPSGNAGQKSWAGSIFDPLIWTLICPYD